MIRPKFNTIDFNRVMKNAIQYSEGFMQGVEMNRLMFNLTLGELTSEALKKYIDAKARGSYDSFHHLYEWGAVGSPGGRLFDLKYNATATTIVFYGKFLPSSSLSDTATEPFVDKARIMENQISIVVEPRFADALAFQGSEGEPVFTVNSIYIDNPGGDAVSGSFGEAVYEFFNTVFLVNFLGGSGILAKLSTPYEFSKSFPAGANGGGRSTGIVAGRRYLSLKGIDIT